MPIARIAFSGLAAWIIAWPLAPVCRAQSPQGTLQGGTYNASAGTGAYTPANPDILGPARVTFPNPAIPLFTPGLPPIRSSRDILNRDILNSNQYWIQQFQLLSQRRALTGPEGKESKAFFQVKVPKADAKLWVNGKLTKQKGLVRVFVSPPLQPGSFRYRFRASWTSNQTQKSAREEVIFQPGADLLIDFSKR